MKDICTTHRMFAICFIVISFHKTRKNILKYRQAKKGAMRTSDDWGCNAEIFTDCHYLINES